MLTSEHARLVEKNRMSILSAEYPGIKVASKADVVRFKSPILQSNSRCIMRLQDGKVNGRFRTKLMDGKHYNMVFVTSVIKKGQVKGLPDALVQALNEKLVQDAKNAARVAANKEHGFKYQGTSKTAESAPEEVASTLD